MLEELNHSGYISVDKTNDVTHSDSDDNVSVINDNDSSIDRVKHYAYEYQNGEIVIHAYDRINEINGYNYIIGHGFDNKTYLIYSQIPFDMSYYSMYPLNHRQKIDFLISGYEMNSKYSEAIFSFEELQYFCSSSSVVKKDDRNVCFSFEPNTIKSFDFYVDTIKCTASLNISSKGKYSFSRQNMETFTELRIAFNETSDFVFLNKIYLIVDSVFAFICNRRNTTCLSMRLKGTYPTKTIKNGKIVDHIALCYSDMFFYDEYRDEPEDIDGISKIWYSSKLIVHIDKLFDMVAKDLSDSEEEEKNISIASIHPSFKRRNLIDLQQSLQITSAFEFYSRRYLPDMTSEKDYHIVMKMILEDLQNKTSGKLKRLAKSMSDGVIREPALKDKVLKAYNGYDSWVSLKNCISEKWFPEDEIEALGEEANLWRNELAHAKRSYDPSVKTIKAIRLIEHINYAIVLRQLGYKDEEICSILENILKH